MSKHCLQQILLCVLQADNLSLYSILFLLLCKWHIIVAECVTGVLLLAEVTMTASRML